MYSVLTRMWIWAAESSSESRRRPSPCRCFRQRYATVTLTSASSDTVVAIVNVASGTARGTRLLWIRKRYVMQCSTQCVLVPFSACVPLSCLFAWQWSAIRLSNLDRDLDRWPTDRPGKCLGQPEVATQLDCSRLLFTLGRFYRLVVSARGGGGAQLQRCSATLPSFCSPRFSRRRDLLATCSYYLVKRKDWTYTLLYLGFDFNPTRVSSPAFP